VRKLTKKAELNSLFEVTQKYRLEQANIKMLTDSIVFIISDINNYIYGSIPMTNRQVKIKICGSQEILE